MRGAIYLFFAKNHVILGKKYMIGHISSKKMILSGSVDLYYLTYFNYDNKLKNSFSFL